MPELEAEAECVIDFDHDVTAGRSACDAWQGRWLYTAVEVGELLGCTTRYVRELVRRGEIHAVPIGRLVRIPAAEVEAFVARRLAGVDQSARPVLGRPGRPAPRPLAPTCDDELPPDLVW